MLLSSISRKWGANTFSFAATVTIYLLHQMFWNFNQVQTWLICEAEILELECKFIWVGCWYGAHHDVCDDKTKCFFWCLTLLFDNSLCIIIGCCEGGSCQIFFSPCCLSSLCFNSDCLIIYGRGLFENVVFLNNLLTLLSHIMQIHHPDHVF